MSELGRLTGRFHLGERRPLIAMNCYFDGSIGGDSNRWMTLAGIIATDEVWGAFENAWAPMLKQRYPIAPYIHMTDVVTGNDPFERKNGWSDERIYLLIEDSKRVVETLNKEHIFTAVFSIDIQACNIVRDEGLAVPDPSVICAEFCLYHLLRRYDEKHQLEKAHLFYDQDEPFIQSIRSRWRSHRTTHEVGVNLFWDRIANVQPADMRDTPQIQLADMVAWGTTRRITRIPDDNWARLADSLVGTRQQNGILPFVQVDPISEDQIRKRYTLNQTDSAL